MVIAWTKQAEAKGHFCHESQLGHVIGPSTAVAYVYWEDMREKKDVVYGLLFLLHDLADLRCVCANPISNPYIGPNFVLIKYPIKCRLTRNINCKRKKLTVKYVVIFFIDL